MNQMLGSMYKSVRSYSPSSLFVAVADPNVMFTLKLISLRDFYYLVLLMGGNGRG